MFYKSKYFCNITFNIFMVVHNILLDLGCSQILALIKKMNYCSYALCPDFTVNL